MPLVVGRARPWIVAAAVVILTAMSGASSALANVLTIVQGTDIESLDVHRVTSSPSYAVLDHIFDTLFQMTPEGKVVPSLATSFEAMPDGRTYRITLREGVTFTDGTPFNAHAVKANLERILDPASQAAFASLISPITEINVIDDLTVDLVTGEPFGPILTHLTHSGLAMISPAVLEKGNEHVAANPVGTGPFVLKEWRQGERIVLAKNDNYWRERGNIEELVFRVVPDDGARLVELEAGTADIALRVPPSEAQHIARRVLYIIPTLIGVTLLVFVSVRLIPGDPAVAIAGERATPQLVEQVRRELGLDQPLLVQYGRNMLGLLQGDLGRSARTNLPVSAELGRRIPPTLLLAVVSLLVAALVGIFVGVLSATRANSWIDNAGMIAALVGVSTPVFWLGLMLMMLFSVELPRRLGLSGPIFPPTGAGTWRHLVMPAITLAAYSTAIIARMTRSAMLDVIGQDFVRTAMAKGLPERLVIYGHALRNAWIPILTILGLQFGQLMGGAVLTETVFAWPGLGKYLVDAIFLRDYAVVQAAVLVIALSFIVINLIVDLLYVLLDPRIRYG